MMNKLLSIACGLLCISCANAQVRQAPAYPLITHDPYFSIWSTSDTLNAATTSHWTGANQSLNGILSVDGKLYNFLGKVEKVYNTIIPAGDETNYTVKYTESKPADGWETASFKDADWKTGAAPFGFEKGDAKTQWRTDNIWTRRTFNLDKVSANKLYLKLNHDENVEVYLNGKQVYSKVGWTDSFIYIPISKDLLKTGENILAIHCVNLTGGRWLDAGLVAEPEADNAANITEAKQTGLKFNATQTIYEFTCGTANLTLTFTSPLLMNNLDLLARPVSYISAKVSANDGNEHQVKLYFGASSTVATHIPFQLVKGVEYSRDGLNILKAGTIEQPMLKRTGDNVRIDWGYMYVGVPEQAKAIQTVSTELDALKILTANTDAAATDLTGKKLVLNTLIPLGTVGKTAKEQFILMGYDDMFSVQYFGNNLRPWWNNNGTETIEHQMALAAQQYAEVVKQCEAFDTQLYNTALKSGGEAYANLCKIAYRQTISAHKLAKSPEGEILFLSKENYSNGSINTVDITYPSAPLFLIYNTELLKGMMNGIFYYSESGRWTKPFASHDLGTYPIANGQTYGEDMPIEESGNMLILSAAIAKADGNAEYAKKHWKTLTIWAEYLSKEGFDPANQLSSDDFSGHLARNANLSVKAIEALGSYGMLANMLGDKTTGKKYETMAKDMAKRWMKAADAGDHYALTFDNKNTWSQKYNMVWDKVLGLNLFPKTVYKKEIDFYLTKQNKYGLPLDSRETYTKSDWVTWSATLADNQKDFDALVAPMYKFAVETSDRSPLTDWHRTTNAQRMNFTARSVVGAYFIKILDDKFKK
ncbi:DUF4965 domain-containing protein [Mucilaginibacter gynuensis]|uniref:DUF4965 domain-containing protein n=1 Tax=Mucilaginibacter gynuensis TaxID=1302236 RepID=A0ABP8GDE8_9SPHI